MNLSIDIETYSSVDLAKSGIYKYVESPDFTILLFAYQLKDDDIKIVDLASEEKLPESIKSFLTLPIVTKTAHNANFERVCISKYLGIELPVDQWQCTMVKASMLGLPLALGQVAKVLNLDEKKDTAGKALIRYFSLPSKPTKANGMRERNLPEHDPIKWQQFKDYCIQDVAVERSIADKINFFTIPDFEKQLWFLDQRINDRGIALDRSFVANAIRMDIANKEVLTEEAIKLTGLDNPNSVAQLKEWIELEIGEDVEKLNKETVPALLKSVDCEIVKRVLTLRQEMSKTSVKKYESMAAAICADSRIRGIHQFYGANRTGRWAGRIVQPQNLPQNHLMDLDLARMIVASNDLDLLQMLYGNVPDTLSQLIRTAFIAPKGNKLIVADFSAIEARVIAWLADEHWRLEVFKTHGKIYEASASQMFRVPITSITKGSDLRQKGKVAELALGYQGGPNALIKMGALKMGLDEKELPKLVKMWRNANPAIVALWAEVEAAAIAAVETGEKQGIRHNISCHVERGILFITLPSGRKLSYMRPKLKEGQYGKQALTYEGMNQTTKQWGIQDTYGGKLVENIVQAIARDCLAEAMIKIDTAGHDIVMHVHDEVVIESTDGVLEDVLNIMREPIKWAKGLPLDAAGFQTLYYKKD